jgi:murein DD-endopeptidase MepM/ murein hydrolase activator NlpD
MRNARWALAVGLLLAAPAMATGQATPEQAGRTLSISTQARALQPGEIVVLDIACACAGLKARATAFGRDVPLAAKSDAGFTGLIGVDVETRPGDYQVAVTIARGKESPLKGAYTLSIAAKKFPTRRLTVAPSFVEPPPAAVKRISREAATLDKLFDTATPREEIGPFRMPVSAKPGNTFGARSIFNGQARNPHGGVDFGSPTGAPIVAPAAGVVALAEDLYFTGNTVILDHGRGLYSVLAHLSKIGVSQGDRVDAGDPVGAVGATGRVTGPHLHWGVRLNGARVDPLSLVAVLKN